MSSQFESAWWRATVPEGWGVAEDKVCEAFESRASSGVIRVSAAKNEARPVTDADLLEFAKERIANRVASSVRTPEFAGIQIEYFDNANFWREWWLRNGDLVLYVTYNNKTSFKGIERALVERFVDGLAPRS